MARRSSKPLNFFDKLFLGIVLFAVVVNVVIRISMAGEQVSDMQYHEDFYSVIESYIADGTQVDGEKAVSLIVDGDSLYSDDYVPEEYRTDDPEEVRYLIRCVRGSTVVGYYSGGGVGTRPWVEVTIEDLKTGKSLGQKTFNGGEPPKSISVEPGETKSRSGTQPSYKEISTWILDMLEGM